MRIRMLFAASSMALLGACATAAPVTEVQPVQRLSGATPQTADTFAQRGAYAQAAAAYLNILQTSPGDAPARYGLAETLRKGGKLDEAKAQYAKLSTIAEWKLRALEGLGLASLASGDRASARQSLNEVVAEDPKAWKAWVGIAELHDLDRQWDRADEAYAMALVSTTQPAIIYNNQGLSRLARGEPDWAAEHFKQALVTDPTLVRAQTNLEIAEAYAGKSLDKVSASERDARERARKLNNSGYVAMLQNRPDEARAFFQAALEQHPSFYPQAFQNLQALDAARPKTTSASQQ
jgi:Tfp pilus assembly protein PilF